MGNRRISAHGSHPDHRHSRALLPGILLEAGRRSRQALRHHGGDRRLGREVHTGGVGSAHRPHHQPVLRPRRPPEGDGPHRRRDARAVAHPADGVLGGRRPGLAALRRLQRCRQRRAPQACIYMATAVRDRELSDRSFFPVYERIADLGLPIFLHPMMINNERLKQYYLINICGNPFDTAIAVCHLIFGGVMDAFPKLEASLPHAGGALPILRGRMDRGFQIRGECKTVPRPPSEYLRRFTYDTISYSEDQLMDLVKLVGAERILMGSDYCFDIAYEEPARFVTGVKGLTAEQKSQILWGNAARLLKL
ncbi:MAG: amidohydrolase family protein [Betaproteobacteria bacterium]|nr:amidohydrolase family protein [Betaproteobacteria bacterium]